MTKFNVNHVENSQHIGHKKEQQTFTILISRLGIWMWLKWVSNKQDLPNPVVILLVGATVVLFWRFNWQTIHFQVTHMTVGGIWFHISCCTKDFSSTSPTGRRSSSVLCHVDSSQQSSWLPSEQASKRGWASRWSHDL